ncbi:hypothetical protein KIN20_018137 [Parelaphostrongylus tenuis]|uniref:Uncharacterized protein n=1 Tax=Parelaphostrongylus tenuis TaxID=148309 RepID=A0AAD5N3A0_PARTN|nr:hypothetical protein KIN20_018137 [Parelaphostrongylus tenuis]
MRHAFDFIKPCKGAEYTSGQCTDYRVLPMCDLCQCRRHLEQTAENVPETVCLAASTKHAQQNPQSDDPLADEHVGGDAQRRTPNDALIQR